MGRSVLRPKEPSKKSIAGRPNNRQCSRCKAWIHKDRFAGHLLLKHGISDDSTKIVSVTSRKSGLAAPERPPAPIAKPTPTAKSKQLLSGSKGANMQTSAKQPKRKKMTGWISPKKQRKIKSKYETKRQKMKELFRDIDAWNFPIGARVTSNSAGNLERGGGFMSNRRKH